MTLTTNDLINEVADLTTVQMLALVEEALHRRIFHVRVAQAAGDISGMKDVLETIHNLRLDNAWQC